MVQKILIMINILETYQLPPISKTRPDQTRPDQTRPDQTRKLGKAGKVGKVCNIGNIGK